MLSLLVTVAVVLVTGSVRECSRCWERSLLLSSLGAVVGGFCWKRSLVDFVDISRRWLLSEVFFGALVGSNPEMVIELA